MQDKSAFVHERETLEALVSALQELPHAHASLVRMQHPIRGAQAQDAEIDLSIGESNVTLLVELKTTVYPRDVPQILWQLRHARNTQAHSPKHNVVPLVAADSISIGARELLRTENVGFFDTGGSLFVPAKGTYLYVDRPVPKALEKSVNSLFTGKRSQVLHALLIKHHDWVGITELSSLADVSPGTASETMIALEQMEWVSTRGQGPSKERRLSDASGLLNEWRTQILASQRPLARRRYYVPGLEISTLARHLADFCEIARIEYVLTQDVAAQQYAPFLSSISRVACRVAPGKAAGEITAKLDARVVSEGSNLDVIETKSHGEFLFKQRKAQFWLASPVQTYLDLLRNEGRSRDMAEHLRKEVLGI